MSADEMFEHARVNRLLAADVIEGLSEAQLATPSLCAGWDVRTVAGHLLMPTEVSIGRLVVESLRRRSFDAASGALGVRLGARPAVEIATRLRAGADSRFCPPGLGPASPMSDSAIHLRDLARPLGLEATPSLRCWSLVLDFLITPAARQGFVDRRRIERLTWRTTDLDRRWGTGPLVAGTSEAVAMAMTGRNAYLDELTGDGVALLRAR